MSKCANCGTELDEGAKFCPECGTPVSQSLKCHACGAELESGAKFCPECGAKQENVTESASKPNSMPNKTWGQVLGIDMNKLSSLDLRSLYKAEQESHHPKLQEEIGKRYLNGSGGVSKDSKQALQWYQKAAEQGDDFAAGQIALIYQGMGNTELFIKWLTYAAELGNSIFQTMLGGYEEKLADTEAKLDAALTWYKKAAAQGYDEAQKAIERIEAAKNLDFESLDSYAEDVLATAEKIHHDSDVQYQLFATYYQGLNGTQKNEAKALEWIKKSADQENAMAERTLGELYYTGTIVTKDEKTALEWLTKAGEHGDSIAQCDLGKHFNGKDNKAAMEWYQKAADQENKNAYHPLGLLYFQNEDYDNYVAYFKKAAENGDEVCKQDLVDFETAKNVDLDNLDSYTEHTLIYAGMFKKDCRPYYMLAKKFCAKDNENWKKLADKGIDDDIIQRIRLSAYYENLKKAAQYNHADAAYELAKMYIDGGTKDYHPIGTRQEHLAEAEKYLQIAISQGHWQASQEIGRVQKMRNINYSGIWAYPLQELLDFAKVLEDARIYKELAERYFAGRSAERNLSEAKKYAQKANASELLKKIQTAENMQSGKDLESFSLQELLDEEAVSHGAKLQREIARKYLHNKEPEKAVLWYRKSAEQGYADAQNALAFRYFEGEGVAKNLTEAVKWWQKAAEQGNATSQCYLAWRYYLGEGVEKNLEESTEWWLKAAKQGDSEAQRCLGNNYSNGEGVEKNPVEAAKWWLKAAEQGDASAQCNIGWAYNNGEGVQKDMNAAVQWYTKAAANGNETAKKNLQNMEYVILENPHVENFRVYLNLNPDDGYWFDNTMPDYMRNCIATKIEWPSMTNKMFFYEIQRFIEFELTIDAFESRKKYPGKSMRVSLFSENGQKVFLDAMDPYEDTYCDIALNYVQGKNYKDIHIPVRFNICFLNTERKSASTGKSYAHWNEWSMLGEYPLPAGNYYLQIDFNDKIFRTPLFYFNSPELVQKFYRDDVNTMIASNEADSGIQAWAQKQYDKWTREQERAARIERQRAERKAQAEAERQAEQNAIYWWMCFYCDASIKGASISDHSVRCPGRNNSGHWWHRIGRVGNVPWTCRQCGRTIYLAEGEIPSDLHTRCPSKENQSHNFTRM